MNFTKSSALATLGLTANATPDEIKKAYRRLAMKHHPDRDKGNEETFKNIKAAFEYLGATPSARTGPRSTEDIFGKKRSSDFARAKAARAYADVGGFNWFNHDDPYDDDFYDADSIYPVKAGDKIFASTFKISLEQAFKGMMLNLKFANCADSVFYVKVLPGTMNGQLVKKILTNDKNGKEIQINVYVEIETGNRNVTWATVPNLYSGGIEGSGNIEHPLEINWIDIMLGRWIKYTPVDGNPVEVRVSPGISAGARIKIQGKGFWKDNNCSARGDVFIRVIPVVPKIADVSVDDLEALIAAKRADVNG